MVCASNIFLKNVLYVALKLLVAPVYGPQSPTLVYPGIVPSKRAPMPRPFRYLAQSYILQSERATPGE